VTVQLSHLEVLESESIHIIREVAAGGTFTEQERYRLADRPPEATTGVSEEHE